MEGQESRPLRRARSIHRAPLPHPTQPVILANPHTTQPSCHANHAPPYLSKVPELKAKGVDVVAVVSANDPFVLSGWSRILGFKDAILALSDPDGAWSEKLGLTVDLSGLGIGLGKRTTRYALVIDDLKVTYVGVSGLFLCKSGRKVGTYEMGCV